jgi:hypothetical protein
MADFFSSKRYGKMNYIYAENGSGGQARKQIVLVGKVSAK